MPFINKPLSGYSGCSLRLMQRDGTLFVRKTAGNAGYNDRLMAQMEKQKAFDHPILRSPKVYGEGVEDGLAYFDMEYINGPTLADLIAEGKVVEASSAVQQVTTLFPISSIPETDDKGVRKKLDCLSKKLEKYDCAEVCIRALNSLYDHAWRLHALKAHGDLTFQNILVSGGNVYLIDFLDGFADCVEADMAKILQDTVCLWAFRGKTLPRASERFLEACSRHVYSVYRAATNCGTDQLCATLILALLRIYPYLKDRYTKDFLDIRLERLLESGLEA